jgi:acyl carrier protein
MTDTDMEKAVLASIAKVAPEADTSSLDRDADIRDELDLDSMDFLNVVTALHDALGVTIPEADYAKVRTVRGAVAYLREKLG